MPLSPYFPLSIGKICTQNRGILAGLSPRDFPLLTLSFAKLVQPCIRHRLPRTRCWVHSAFNTSKWRRLLPSDPFLPEHTKAESAGFSAGGCHEFPSQALIIACVLLKEHRQTASDRLCFKSWLSHLASAAQNHSSLVWKKGASVCAQSCQTLCDPMDCRPAGSSVHGISQARILEWVVISFSRGPSQPRDQTRVSCLAGGCFTTEPPGKPNGR